LNNEYLFFEAMCLQLVHDVYNVYYNAITNLIE